LGACTRVDDDGAVTRQQRHAIVSPRPAEASASDSPTPSPDDPVAGIIGCDGIFSPSDLAVPDFSADGACVTPVGGSPSKYYDACVEGDWTVTSCTLTVGFKFCKVGYWTTLCLSDMHCPESMRCGWGTGAGSLPADESYGWCVEPCSASSPCRVCGLECDTKLGICKPPQRDEEEGESGEHTTPTAN